MFVRLSKKQHRQLAQIRDAEKLPSSEAALGHAIEVASILVEESPPPGDGDEDGEGVSEDDASEGCGDSEPSEA